MKPKIISPNVEVLEPKYEQDIELDRYFCPRLRTWLFRSMIVMRPVLPALKDLKPYGGRLLLDYTPLILR